MKPEIALSDDLATCQALRRIVFIEEQGVSEADEVDGQDGEARHLLVRVAGEAVGTARLLKKGASGKVGRVCVLASHRGQGIGAALIRAAVSEFRATPGVTEVILGAQTHALGFYRALGFEPFGPLYQDAGIEHQDMRLRLA